MDSDSLKIVDRYQMLAFIEQTEDGGIIPLRVTGFSMRPTLLDRRSIVYLKKDSTYVPRRGDIVLFARPDRALVLHRVVKLLPDGTLLINGDAQNWTEIIQPGQILAHVTHFQRRVRMVSAENRLYRLYVRLWMPLRPLHPPLARINHIWHRIPYKLFPKYMAKKNMD